ncbi:hypothetical protein [[Flexibacter] sp. ATCC 35208]|nr:hypothetical protein [[Flexibacter] sp. ATCC 35208]
MIRYTPAKQLTLEGFSTPFSQQLFSRAYNNPFGLSGKYLLLVFNGLQLI